MTRSALRREDRDPSPLLLGDPANEPADPPPPIVPPLPGKRPAGPLRPTSERAQAAARSVHPHPSVPASVLAVTAAAIEPHVAAAWREGFAAGKGER